MNQQRAISDIVAELVGPGGEIALQVAAVRDGETIVDVAMGPRDGVEGAGLSIDGGSVFPVFSVSKGVTALVAHRAVARGLIDFGTPIATVWPEFAARGKGDITLGELLVHTAGLARMPEVHDFSTYCDWAEMARLVAAQSPEFRGEMRYHAITYGWLIGETLRRAVGESGDFGAMMRRELLAEGPSDFWFGIPDDVESRVVTVVRAVNRTDDGHPLLTALPNRFATTQEVYGRPDVRRACVPGINGIGNARTLASLYSRASDGMLLHPDLLDEATRVHIAGIDGLMGTYVARGLGFYVAADGDGTWMTPFESNRSTFGYPGGGGSFAWGDRASRTGFAILRSRLTGDGWRHPNIQRLVSALRDL